MKKILVVDNQPLMLNFMAKLLEKNGYEVVTANDGLSALDCMETFEPDIIFSDLIMPNIDGEKLCRIIKSRPELSHIFLVILSGIAMEKDMDYTEFGADVCIAKGPFNQIEKNVLEVLEKLNSDAFAGFEKKIIGVEDIYRREVTVELLTVRKHSEVILSNISEGILELTSEKKIIFANSAAVSVIGMSEEQLLGQYFENLFLGNHHSRIINLLSEIDGSPVEISEDLPVELNGKEVSMKLLPVNEEKHSTIIVIVSKISERKKLELQLQKARKMEAVGTLAGGVAHEFNNALIGITGNIELLKMDLPDYQPMDEYLKPMLASAHRMARLTKQLLAYAKGGKYRTCVISLNELIEETIMLTKHKISPTVRLETDIPSDEFYIEADLIQMQMVLSAIVANADEAIDGKGRIKISARIKDVDETFVEKLAGFKPGRYVCLIVQDNGKGMDDMTKSKVFEPFFTTYFHGRGLGLAAAYGIVKNHNGWIYINSEVGKGTVATVYLPAVETTKIK